MQKSMWIARDPIVLLTTLAESMFAIVAESIFAMLRLTVFARGVCGWLVIWKTCMCTGAVCVTL